MEPENYEGLYIVDAEWLANHRKEHCDITGDEVTFSTNAYVTFEDVYTDAKHIDIPLDRLTEICNAERDGRCVVLPCKVGDRIWIIENVFNGKGTVQMLDGRVIDEITHNNLNKNTMISKQPFELHFYPSEIGKTVFLTRDEAEAALKGGSRACLIIADAKNVDV